MMLQDSWCISILQTLKFTILGGDRGLSLWMYLVIIITIIITTVVIITIIIIIVITADNMDFCYRLWLSHSQTHNIAILSDV